MKNILKISFLIIVLSIFTGCSSNVNYVPVFLVERSDFNDFISIEGTAEPVHTTNVLVPSNVQGTAVYVIPDGVYVTEGDVICEIEDKNLENELEANLLNLENARATLLKTKADLGLRMALLEADMRSLDASTEIANLDSLQLIFSTENIKKIRELEIKKANLSKKKLAERLEKLRLINDFEIKKQERGILRNEEFVNTLKSRMESLVVKSPKAGLAVRSLHWITGAKITEGDGVFNGMPIVTIPDVSIMKVTISATESEFKRINIDNPVVFTFDASPDNIAWGKILKKSPVGKQIKPNSLVKYFDIEASVDSSKVQVTPGLSAICKISVSNIKDTVVIPQIAVFDEDSIKVVYVKKDNFFEMRRVVTANSSLKSVVISSGLKENEEIALLKPLNNLIKQTKY